MHMGLMEAIQGYYKGLNKKLKSLEQLAAASTEEERIRLNGKIEGVKLAIQDFEHAMHSIR